MTQRVMLRPLGNLQNGSILVRLSHHTQASCLNDLGRWRPKSISQLCDVVQCARTSPIGRLALPSRKISNCMLKASCLIGMKSYCLRWAHLGLYQHPALHDTLPQHFKSVQALQLEGRRFSATWGLSQQVGPDRQGVVRALGASSQKGLPHHLARHRQ